MSNVFRKLQELAMTALTWKGQKRPQLLPFNQEYQKLADSLMSKLPAAAIVLTRKDKKGPHYLIPDNVEMRRVIELRKRFGIIIEPEMNLKNDESVGFLKKLLSSWYNKKDVDDNGGKVSNFFIGKGHPRTFGQKICIVGVHGWFPTKVLQTVIGVPKGTSTRLCKMMEENLKEFLDKQPLAYFERPPKISCVALEGAGCIDERVTNHYNQLDSINNNNDEIITKRKSIEEADTIIFVAHSQGAPVTALLAARLITEGVINPKTQNVGVLTLAGVFHGPFPGLKENLVVKYVEADAARELFDLNNADGELAVRIQSSISLLLSNDVLFSCVASWMDQVVPLYSATLLGFDHPNIWRSIYIDAHNYRPDFLSSLATFALKLANARVEDARLLLAQLTEPLAGSLYQSNAHSTLYDDHGVYQLILHWFCSMDRNAKRVIPILHPKEMKPRINENPYKLPWIMRGLLSSRKDGMALTRDEGLAQDIQILKELHKSWRPDRKVWKDLQLQFDPIHSKL